MSANAKPVKRVSELAQDPRRMRRRRLMARLSFREAEAKSGISCGHISDLEKGHKSAGVTALSALADAYGCEVEDFLPLEAAAA